MSTKIVIMMLETSILIIFAVLPQITYGHLRTEGPENFDLSDPQVQQHLPYIFVDESGIQRCSKDATEQNNRLAGNCIQGRGGNDLITCNSNHCHLYGDAGNDKLVGGPGNDYLHGTNGNDDIIGNEGSDTIFGDLGNDRYSGGPGADLFHCGPGNDAITDFENNIDRVVINVRDCAYR
jgi:hypothetical protein